MSNARNLARVLADTSGAIAATNLANAVPADGSITTAKLAANAVTATKVSGALAKSNMASGSVIQAISTTKTDVFSAGNGADWTDVTGLSVTITPTSASNKILVLVSFTLAGTGNTFSRLQRGSTLLFVGDARGGRDRASSGDGYTGGLDNANMSNSIVHLDSPATTSPTTYKLRIRPETVGSGYNAWINTTRGDPDTFNRPSYASSITVMEIAA